MNTAFERLEEAREAPGTPRKALGLKVTGNIIQALGIKDSIRLHKVEDLVYTFF